MTLEHHGRHLASKHIGDLGIAMGAIETSQDEYLFFSPSETRNRGLVLFAFPNASQQFLFPPPLNNYIYSTLIKNMKYNFKYWPAEKSFSSLSWDPCAEHLVRPQGGEESPAHKILIL